MGSFGLGATTFDFIQHFYVNPQNAIDAPDIGFMDNVDVMQRVPPMFVMLSSVFLTMQILGVILMSNPRTMLKEPEHRMTASLGSTTLMHPEDSQLGRLSISSLSPDAVIPVQECNEVLTPSQALCTVAFWHLFAISMLNVIVFLFIVSEWKELMGSVGIDDDYFKSMVGSVAALCNGICRVLWGLYYDWNRSFALSMATMTVLLTAFIGAIALRAVRSKLLCSIWFVVLFCCIGGSYSLYPKAIVRIYGTTYSGAIIGYLLLAEIPAVFVFVVICNETKSISESQGELSWRTMTMTLISFLSAILSISYRMPSQNEGQDGDHNDYHKMPATIPILTEPQQTERD